MAGLGYWRQVNPQVTLESLFRNRAELCFLAGSGISCDAPTGFPNGGQFTKMLLEHVLPSEVQEDVLALMNPEREGMQNPGDFLRFEGLLMHVQESFDPALQVLYGFGASVASNPIHKFLACMIIHGNSVFTTNFDSLIEDALLCAGISREKVFPVIHDTDWESESESDRYRVYKLHGSLFDVHWETHCAESLQATLTQIAQNKSELFLLEPWKQEVMEPHLRRFDLVVLGYSGLDDFDVLPTLWSIHSDRRILWVSHDSKRTVPQARIEMVEDAQSQAEPAATPKVDRVGGNLLRFIKYQTRHPSQLIRIHVHTGQLIEWLSQQYFRQSKSEKDIGPGGPGEVDKFWLPSYLNISEFQRWMLAAELLEERNDLDKSLEAYSIALVECPKGGEKEKAVIGSIFNAMGRLFHRMVDHKGAEENYQSALKIAKNVGDLGLQSQSLNNIGRLFSDQDRPEEALKVYKEALSIAKSEDNAQGKSTILNNIGLCLLETGDLDGALVHYRQSVELAVQLGNLRGVVSSLNGIAMILRRQSRLDESLGIYQQAIKTAQLLGDAEAVKVISGNLASIFVDETSKNVAVVLL